MKIKHLLEGAEPKLPGAPKGIQIMTPQQFVAKSNDSSEEMEEGYDEVNPTLPSPQGVEKIPPVTPYGTKERQFRGSIAEASPEATFNALKGLKSWQVVIMNNYYRGKYADYSGRYYYVLASSPEEAEQVVLDNADAILQELLAMKSVNGRKILPRGSALRITADRIGEIRDGTEHGRMSTAGFKRMFGPQGPLMVKLSGGAVVDVQGQEQGVAEVADKYGFHTSVSKGKFLPSKYGQDENNLYLHDLMNVSGDGSGPQLVTIDDKRIATELAAMYGGYVERTGMGTYRVYQPKGMRKSVKQPELTGVAEGSIKDAEHALARHGQYKVDHEKKYGPMSGADLHQHEVMRKQLLDKKRRAQTAYAKKQGVAEATKLPASTRELKGQELEDYLDRIRNREKTKQDKYKMPYIHRSSVLGYYNEEGKKYDTGAIKEALKQRPKKLLKQNEKMKHSNGELEQFFNIGFAALTGIALDENTNELIIVNTCPGAGSCKVDCFAMKGGKIQFQGPWLSDGRILTYLLNEPDQFFQQLSAEISKEEKAGAKGGYKVTIRWHDAGDFFSPEYVDMAFKLAEAHPNVQFYAYTKMGDVAIGNKPDNFIINWSEGAHTSQEKKVKAADPSLERTKNSRIVPSNLFYDLLVKDEKKNLVKGPEGQWQVIPDKLPELKQRLAKQYGISANSILSYNEWDQKTDGGKKETPVKYNVIITPGEPDITAKSHGVLSTLLLKH